MKPHPTIGPTPYPVVKTPPQQGRGRIRRGRILALVESPDHVCDRYRIAAFEPWLHAFGYELERLPLSQTKGPARWLALARSGRFHAVLLQRKLLAPWELAILRGFCRRLVYDFDDAVMLRDSHDPRGPFDRRRRIRFGIVMKQADAILAGNSFLADRAVEAGADPHTLRVLPTCVEPPDPATLSRSPAFATTPRPAGAGLLLGWIGSSSTLKGLEKPRAIWDAVAKALPGVRLRAICDRAPDLGSLAVEWVPWSRETETTSLAECDVGISHIPDDLWSRGKCGLKLLQAMAVGLPVVANPVGVHPEMIEPNVNGFLAVTPEQWVDALTRLTNDPALRKNMGQAGRLRVERDYSVAIHARSFVEALLGEDAFNPSTSFDSGTETLSGSLSSSRGLCPHNLATPLQGRSCVRTAPVGTAPRETRA